MYVVQHDAKTKTSAVKETHSLTEALAYAGTDDLATLDPRLATATANLPYGTTLHVTLGKEEDFWEKNWYKLVTALAVVTGIVVSLRK